MYVLLMFIAMLAHQRVHRICLLFTHPNDLQFIANDISRRWVNFTNIYAQRNPLKSSQEFSASFFGKANSSKANEQKNISPTPKTPEKSKNNGKKNKKHEQNIIIESHTFPPFNQPNQPTTNDDQPRNGQRPKGHHQWLRKRTQRGRQGWLGWWTRLGPRWLVTRTTCRCRGGWGSEMPGLELGRGFI